MSPEERFRVLPTIDPAPSEALAAPFRPRSNASHQLIKQILREARRRRGEPSTGSVAEAEITGGLGAFRRRSGLGLGCPTLGGRPYYAMRFICLIRVVIVTLPLKLLLVGRAGAKSNDEFSPVITILMVEFSCLTYSNHWDL